MCPKLQKLTLNAATNEMVDMVITCTPIQTAVFIAIINVYFTGGTFKTSILKTGKKSLTINNEQFDYKIPSFLSFSDLMFSGIHL